MNACESLRSRLYDDDAQSALVSGAPAPADLQVHLGVCGACGRLWNESRAERDEWAACLGEGPSTRLRARVLLEAHALTAAPRMDWCSLALWGVSGGALGTGVAILAQPVLTPFLQTAIVCVGFFAMLTTDMTRQALEESRC